ncbi:hypothetical protein ACFLT7_08745, partial [candidate division KSB1 bacterium]
ATDKRVGKTAFGNYVGRILSGLSGRETPWGAIIMTHSRGGPPEPPIVNIFEKGDGRPAKELTPEEMFNRRFQPAFLENLLKFGLHGGSDVFEDALILSEYMNAYERRTGRDAPSLSIIGCRRAGAGYFHEFAVSNVDLGLARAAECQGNYILHEGSGGEHPPVKVDSTITLIPADSDLDKLTDFPGLSATDLVILAHCQPETAGLDRIAQVEERLKERNPDLPILRSLFEPEILGDQQELAATLKGKRAYCFTTAPEIVKDRLAAALERDYGVKMIGVSCHLSRDDLMRKDIEEVLALPEPPEAFVIEIKARGVEAARHIHESSGLPYYYINNVPRQVDPEGNPVPGNPDLDEAIHNVLTAGAERFNNRRGTDFPTG